MLLHKLFPPLKRKTRTNVIYVRWVDPLHCLPASSSGLSVVPREREAIMDGWMETTASVTGLGLGRLCLMVTSLMALGPLGHDHAYPIRCLLPSECLTQHTFSKSDCSLFSPRVYITPPRCLQLEQVIPSLRFCDNPTNLIFLNLKAKLLGENFIPSLRLIYLLYVI